MTNTELTNLAQSLMELPTKIEAIQHEILERTTMSSRISDEVVKMESKIKSDINSAVDANGKKVYSNAEARDAAFIDEIENHADLMSRNNEFVILQREIQERKIEIECLNNQQRNIRSILNFFANSSETADQF